MNAAVLQSFACHAEMALHLVRAACLPPEIEGLSVDSISSTFGVCRLFDGGSINYFEKSSLNEVVMAQRRVARILARFPHGVTSAIQRSLPAQHKGDSSYLYVRRIFGRLWRALFYDKDKYDEVPLGFLRKAFLDALISEWQGPFATSEHDLTAQFRMKWIPAWHAKRFLSTFMHSAPLRELVDSGEVEGLRVQGRKARVEFWVKREDLERWAEKQKKLISQYITITAARKQLGLTWKAMQVLVHERLVGIYETAGLRGHHRARYVLRSQIEDILSWFDNAHVPETENYEVGETMALGDAVWGLIGRRKGLPSTIRAVKEGTLKARGRTQKSQGIMSYIFQTVDLCRFSRMTVNGARHIAEDTPLSLNQAAELLNVNKRLVSELLRLGNLKYFVGHRSRGRFVLVSAKSLDAFEMKFVRARDAAKQLKAGNMDSNKVLREFGIPVVHFGSWAFVRRTGLEQKLKDIDTNANAA